MANAATTTFYLGGSSNAALGFQVIKQRKRSVLPRTRDTTERIDSKHGLFDYGAKLRERIFEFDCCAVDCSTPEEVATFRQTLAAFLVDMNGDPDDLAFYFADETDRTYTVRYSGKMEMSREAGNTLGYFRLILVAFDPFGYADAAVEVSENITGSPEEEALANIGTISTPVLIHLTNNGLAAITNPTLTFRVEAP